MESKLVTVAASSLQNLFISHQNQKKILDNLEKLVSNRESTVSAKDITAVQKALAAPPVLQNENLSNDKKTHELNKSTNYIKNNSQTFEISLKKTLDVIEYWGENLNRGIWNDKFTNIFNNLKHDLQVLQNLDEATIPNNNNNIEEVRKAFSEDTAQNKLLQKLGLHNEENTNNSKDIRNKNSMEYFITIQKVLDSLDSLKSLAKWAYPNEHYKTFMEIVPNNILFNLDKNSLEFTDKMWDSLRKNKTFP